MTARWFWKTAMAVAGLVVTGCGGYGAVCADAMDCVGGNDADIEACEIQAEAQEERAAINGCDQEFSDWAACFEEKATCADRSFSDRGYCEREAEDLERCSDKSDNNGNGGNNGVGKGDS